jgi:hypothetical protein
MVAAVDLDQLADAGAAVARLVDLGSSPAARLPQACFGHQPSITMSMRELSPRGDGESP